MKKGSVPYSLSIFNYKQDVLHVFIAYNCANFVSISSLQSGVFAESAHNVCQLMGTGPVKLFLAALHYEDLAQNLFKITQYKKILTVSPSDLTCMYLSHISRNYYYLAISVDNISVKGVNSEQ